MAITRMDQATAGEWETTFRLIAERNSKYPDRILELLKSLKLQNDGYAVDQLEHALQTATRAHQAGATEELTVACLCHDLGKVILNKGHPEISAALLKPFVSADVYNIIRTHQDFQCRYYSSLTGSNPDSREKHQNETWYNQACQLSDDWDQCSFDPEFKSLPLSYFEPMIRRIFSPENNQTYSRDSD